MNCVIQHDEQYDKTALILSVSMNCLINTDY